MSNIYEQRFFSALKDTFIGHPIKGKSGYVNLMGKVSMDKEAYNRELPGIDKDETLFPKEKACFTHP